MLDDKNTSKACDDGDASSKRQVRDNFGLRLAKGPTVRSGGFMVIPPKVADVMETSTSIIPLPDSFTPGFDSGESRDMLFALLLLAPVVAPND